MLKNLEIENIAVIERASVDFAPGLNVMTGETGAGKSIIVDSINAVLGERTSRELVRHGCENAFVSALFDEIPADVAAKISELGYETDSSSLLISRKITLSGKSVCKINGRPATVSILKQVGSLLVNIHGQHDSQALLNPDFQYKYIDMLAGESSCLAEYKESFRRLIAVRRRLKELTSAEADKDSQLELLNYQINELEQTDIKPGEKDELLKKRELISKSEAIITALSAAREIIDGDDESNGMQSAAGIALNILSPFDETTGIAEIFADVADRCETARDKIESLVSGLNFDPGELERIEERLDLLYRFSSKYGSTEEEMLDFLENAVKKRDSIIYSDRELEMLNNEYDKIFAETMELADRLSAQRKKTAADFEREVKAELEFLDMPKLQFKVSFDKGILKSVGYDKIEFLISTNPGEPPKALSKIASGGELSRIMLAIKNILSYNDTIGTLIFDEIDTGVSGRASQKIGLKLKAVSKNTQVICVTHSAQIASNADEHFLIQKKISAGRTFTGVSPLCFDERVQELARIMGGLEITDSLRESARELLRSNM